MQSSTHPAPQTARSSSARGNKSIWSQHSAAPGAVRPRRRNSPASCRTGSARKLPTVRAWRWAWMAMTPSYAAGFDKNWNCWQRTLSASRPPHRKTWRPTARPTNPITPWSPPTHCGRFTSAQTVAAKSPGEMPSRHWFCSIPMPVWSISASWATPYPCQAAWSASGPARLTACLDSRSPPPCQTSHRANGQGRCLLALASTWSLSRTSSPAGY